VTADTSVDTVRGQSGQPTKRVRGELPARDIRKMAIQRLVRMAQSKLRNTKNELKLDLLGDV
jgi:hypothetical protein